MLVQWQSPGNQSSPTWKRNAPLARNQTTSQAVTRRNTAPMESYSQEYGFCPQSTPRSGSPLGSSIIKMGISCQCCQTFHFARPLPTAKHPMLEQLQVLLSELDPPPFEPSRSPHGSKSGSANDLVRREGNIDKITFHFAPRINLARLPVWSHGCHVGTLQRRRL